MNELGLNNSNMDGVDHFEKCQVKVELKKLKNLSDFNMEDVKIKDYKTYFDELYEHLLSSGRIEEIPELSKRPVVEFRDKLLSIDTIEEHSILLHIPHLSMT